MKHSNCWSEPLITAYADEILYAEVSRRVELMTADTIPAALKSIIGAVQSKRRTRKRGGRTIQPVSDPKLAARRKAERERVQGWRDAKVAKWSAHVINENIRDGHALYYGLLRSGTTAIDPDIRIVGAEADGRALKFVTSTGEWVTESKGDDFRIVWNPKSPFAPQ